MASAAKIIKSDLAKDIVNKAGELLKNKDKVKLKKAEDLLIKEKKSD